jgi:DNA-binding transcriptional LysR family regulator
MRSDSSEAIKAMVRVGLGMTVLLLWNVEADLQKSNLKVIETEAPPLTTRLALIRARGARLSSAVLEFVSMAHKVKSKYLRPVKSPYGL